jgi:(heptosyl)LPS beta-1,4-glucosyltransferase
VKLGGFVIHRSDSDTLGACLDSLLAVCDEVVALDAGSAEVASVVSRPRVRAVRHPWEGYGAARAAAAEALRGCDYLLFLDSDEELSVSSVAALRAWWSEGPREVYYALPVRDWALLPEARFLYRVEHHVRLLRADAARWSRSMIVHEALPPGPTVRVNAPVEHRFATSLETRAWKNDRYALLWAVRFAAERRRPKVAWLQRAFHVVRDCLLKGALFRGGLDALRIAWAVSSYHAAKYAYLAAVRSGDHVELLDAFQGEQYEQLFRLLS